MLGMMTMLTINFFIFLGILIFVSLTSSYLAGLILVFVLSIWEIVEHGMAHSMFLLVCELTFALFIVKETELKKDDSPLLKYNPAYKKNALPRKVQLIICSIFLLAFIVRIIAISNTAIVGGRSRQEAEYRRDANAFINQIVIAHKMGEDYHSIARHNPFTNEVFVCKVVALLESEYGRVDELSTSISMAIKSTERDRALILHSLAAECIAESSNVVQRIVNVGIGGSNEAKMAKDFSDFYLRLHKKCCDSVICAEGLAR